MPYTFVEACKIHGMLLKQIFIHDGQPIRMHIDSSIANVNVRATLSARIMVSHLRYSIRSYPLLRFALPILLLVIYLRWLYALL